MTVTKMTVIDQNDRCLKLTLKLPLFNALKNMGQKLLGRNDTKMTVG